MKQIKIVFSGLLILIYFSSCNENLPAPIEKSKQAPGSVTVTNITNIAGGAIITYDLPGDPDLLYVMARYIEKGVRREFKASFYTNTLKVEGLSREEKYKVELIAVNRSELRSEAVTVEIEPLTPPVMVAYSTLRGEATFGGITVYFENPSEATLAIAVMTTDSTGHYYEHDTYYTSQPAGKFSVRGFDDHERVFRSFVRDRWENTSDTITFAPIIPIKETELDKKLFKELVLKTDASSTEWGGQLRFIWDDRRFGDNEGEWGLHTGNEVGDGSPKHISFDLGVEASLSRFKLWPVMDDKHMYDDMSPRKYEVWGRIKPVDPITDSGNLMDGNWFLMGTLENIKPSGLPVGSLTDEDRDNARRGDEIVFEYKEFTARYIRIRCLLNWSNNTNMCFSEVSFWATESKLPAGN